jgi:hypothetical protein
MPPPTGGTPPPTGGTPPPPEGIPPSIAEGTEEAEVDENDVEENVETLEDADTQNSSPSGQLQHRPGGKAHKGKCLAITAFNTPYLSEYGTSPTPTVFKLQNYNYTE